MNRKPMRVSISKLNSGDDFDRTEDGEDDVDSHYKSPTFPVMGQDNQVTFSVRNSLTQVGLMLQPPPQSSTNLSEKVSSPETETTILQLPLQLQLDNQGRLRCMTMRKNKEDNYSRENDNYSPNILHEQNKI